MLDITLIPILKDNYVFFAKDNVTGMSAIIDPGEAKPVIDFLDSRGEKLDLILNTHHHGDHIGGNKALIEKYGCEVIGPESETHRIKTITKPVMDGDTIKIGSQSGTVIEVPGHTIGHIVYYFAESNALFVGDTLFAMGCGRLFEGTPAQMWHSLNKLKKLPLKTKVYCAHEYTQHNGNFCLTIEPNNQDLIDRMNEVKNMRAQNIPTVPTKIGLEVETNALFRAETVEEFAEIREKRDNW